MGKTISEQIEELQCENTRLKNLEKLIHYHENVIQTDNIPKLFMGYT